MEWVIVYNAMGSAEAAVIRSVLEAENIRVRTSRESIGRLYNLTLNGLGSIDVMVPDNMVEKAISVLKISDRIDWEEDQ